MGALHDSPCTESEEQQQDLESEIPAAEDAEMSGSGSDAPEQEFLQGEIAELPRIHFSGIRPDNNDTMIMLSVTRMTIIHVMSRMVTKMKIMILIMMAMIQ